MLDDQPWNDQQQGQHHLHRCTFILTSGTGTGVGNVSLQGGKLDITAPTPAPQGPRDLPGSPRQPVPDNCNLINGNSSSTFQGAIYFPNQQLRSTERPA